MNKKIGNIFKGDKVIWMVFFFLCMISIVEVFSASSGLTYKSQNYVGPIAYHTFTILAGVVVAIITLNIPCRYFKLMTPFLILISVVTLLWVLLAGTKVGDAGRWINLFGFTFQPSEIAKGTIVLAVAQILAAMQQVDSLDFVARMRVDRTGEPLYSSYALCCGLPDDVHRTRPNQAIGEVGSSHYHDSRCGFVDGDVGRSRYQ